MRGGVIKGQGRKGFGIETFVIKQYNHYAPEWWAELKRLSESWYAEDKKLAFEQFNKIQLRLLPAEIKLDQDIQPQFSTENVAMLTFLAEGIRTQLKEKECLPKPKSQSTSSKVASMDLSSLTESKQKKAKTR